MLFEICTGLVVLLCIIIIVYLLTKSNGPVTIEKNTENGNTILKIKANKEIKKLEVKSQDKEIVFTRSNLKINEIVEFIFPIQNNPYW